jgi:curved DNA-binding protein CbpA
MGTLYDLLGALPDDDAEGLRIAFRRAAKAAHPDTNPDDPDAALRFRQLVRAHTILSDAEQRETYDQLLAIATRPSEPPRRAVVYEKVHRFATNTIAATIIAGVLIGGYAFFGPTLHTPAAMEVSAQASEGPPPGPATAVRVVHPARDRNEEAGSRSESVAAASEPDATAVVVSPIGAAGPPLPIMPGPAFLPTTVDAKTYRERGMFAYRDGDLTGALADFNRAIEQDPRFAAAYIDRGIVFYRLRNFDRAFADMAQAKRLTKPERKKSVVARVPQPPAPIRMGYVPGPRWRMTAATTP